MTSDFGYTIQRTLKAKVISQISAARWLMALKQLLKEVPRTSLFKKGHQRREKRSPSNTTVA
jgi:hypothetical protein